MFGHRDMLFCVAVAGEARPTPRTLGRYELIASIGIGGMAEVHLARQRGPMGFEKLVVVKTIHGHLAAQRDFIEMLLEEARIAALVKHANVVDIYDLGEVDGAYFIAMEYLEGEPLLAILRAGKQGTRLDPLSTTRLIADCAEGLHAAHELHAMSGQPLSVVHHDVSPGNVMVLYSGEVKLVDFGVAKAENTVEQAGERVLMKGKLSYMAPEKLRGAPGDRRSDVFSLGVVLWEALTLRRLFRADGDKEVARMIVESTVPPPSSVAPGIPTELDAIVQRALAKEPDQRYPTAKAMAAALEELLRKRGYSGKNDKIGDYMHTAFGDRLAQRRELIRSMSGSGAAPSAQAIARAFRTDQTLGVDSHPALVLPAPEAPPGSAFEPGIRPPTEELSFAEIAIVGTATGATGEMSRSQLTPVPPARRDAVVMGGVIALGLVVALVGFVLTRADDAPAPASEPAAVPTAPVIAAVAQEPEPPRPPPVGLDQPAPAPAPAPTPDPGPVSTRSKPARGKSSSKDIDRGIDKNIDKLDNKTKPPPPEVVEEPAIAGPSPDALVKAGSKLYVAGKAREALASFEQARDRAPGFAPAYRGIGMAKLQLGDKRGAAAAFRKYLQLAPKANDAASIKARLEKL
jgi:serine/threonine protein kinase